MRRFGWIVLVLVAATLAAAPAAHAEKRIALLIGNQSYTSEIGRLANPHNDIALLEKALKGLGFEVSTARDAGLAALHQAVNAYARRVRAAGPNTVGFFYYAGHGAADAGTNYLIPVDVKSAEEGELWDVSLRLTEITRKLKAEAGNATHFVVFDACRNNLKLRKAGSRALIESRGFVPVSQESGMLIAYATAEGELASDVGAGAGPYSSVLAEEIVKPGVEAVTMFRNVQRRVRAAIKQEPYLGFNALGDVYLAGLATDSPTAAAAASAQPSEAAEAWSAAKESTNIAVLEAFVGRFQDTFQAALARARIEELRKQAALSTNPTVPSEFVDGRRGVDFTEQDMARIVAFANRKRIALPSFKMQKPKSDVSADLKRFLGIWVSEYGYTGTGRQFMLIITSVDAGGTATGFRVMGPATPKSKNPDDPPRREPFRGRISDNALTFVLPGYSVYSGWSWVVTWTPQNQLSVIETWKSGTTATVLLAPAWQYSN